MFRTLSNSLLPVLVLSLILVPAAAPAQDSHGSVHFSPVTVAAGDSYQVALSNLFSDDPLDALVEILDDNGDVLANNCDPVDKFCLSGPLPVAAGQTTLVAVFSPDGALLSARVAFREPVVTPPLISAQTLPAAGAGCQTGIWGTNGTAIRRNELPGGGAPRPSGARRFLAFPSVHVASGQVYRLTFGNPYETRIDVEVRILDATGHTLEGPEMLTLEPGSTQLSTISRQPSASEELIGVVEILGPASHAAPPLAGLEVVGDDGRVGIWGTNGTAIWGSAGTALDPPPSP